MAHKPNEADLRAELGVEAINAKYAQRPLRLDTVRAAITDVTRAFLGVRELGTSNSGYWIQKFLKSVGLGEGHPWCMAYVQWCYWFVSEIWNMSDLLPRNTGSTQGCWLWAKELDLVHSDPERVSVGDIVIWRNGLTAEGHTGIIIQVHREVGDDRITTIEGNTNAAHSRDGGQAAEHIWSVGRWGPWGDKAAAPLAKAGRRYVRGVISLEALMSRFWRAD